MADLRFRVVITNEKDVRRLARAAAILGQLAEDLQWRPEIKKAARLIKKAARGLAVERSHENRHGPAGD